MEHNRVSKKNAEESQLLAEERWIIEAIKKIRTQRNCLQIERLQLESMLSLFKQSNKVKESAEARPKEIATKTTEDLTTPADDIKNPNSLVNFGLSTNASNQLSKFDNCNVEELNLCVTNPSTLPMSMEDYVEEEYESDEEMLMDLNMLMNVDDG